MPVTNEKYAQLYKEAHDAGNFHGKQAGYYVDNIKRLIEITGTKTLMDYGCGKALCYELKKIHKQWGGIMPSLYDPYYKPFNGRPIGNFDGVICTDVLEHVPEEDVMDVIEDIFGYATKFVFLTISTKEARKCLSNGENAHATVKPEAWWKYKLSLADNKPGLIEVAFTC